MATDPLFRRFLGCELSPLALLDITPVTLDVTDLLDHSDLKGLCRVEKLNADGKTATYLTAPRHSRCRQLQSRPQMRHPQPDDGIQFDRRVPPVPI